MAVDEYERHAAKKRAERAGVAAGPDDAGTLQDGWWWRLRPDGSTEWRPDGEDWAPPGFTWAMDEPGGHPHYSGATGEKIKRPKVPKLKQILAGPTHPSKRPAVHYDAPFGERYR